MVIVFLYMGYLSSLYSGGCLEIYEAPRVNNGRPCIRGFGILICLTAYTVFNASFSFLGIFVYNYLVNGGSVPNSIDLLALLSALYIFSMISAGVFIDLFGGEKIIMISFSLIVSAILAITAIWLPSVAVLNVATVLLVCVTAWLPIALGSYIKMYIGVECRGTIYGLGTGIGNLIAFALYSLNDVLSLKIVMAVIGVITAIAGITVLLTLEDKMWFEHRVSKPVQLFYRRIPSLSLGIFVFYTMAGYVTVKIYPVLSEFSSSVMAYTAIVPYLVFVITAGFLVDYIGRKPIGIAGFILLSIGNTFLAIYENHPSILLSAIIPLMIIRIAYSFIDVYTVVTLIDLAGRRSKGLTLSVGLIAMSTGILLGSILAGLITASRLSVVMGTLILIASMYIISRIPETLPKRTMERDEIMKYIGKAKKVAEKEQ